MSAYIKRLLADAEAKLFEPMRAKGHKPQHVEQIIGRVECSACGLYSVGQQLWGRLGSYESWAEMPACVVRPPRKEPHLL